MLVAERVPGAEDEATVPRLVREVVAERHTLERAAVVGMDSALDRDLGLDSLAVAELLSRLERAFGVSLRADLLRTAATPRDLLAAVRSAPRSGPARLTPVRATPPARVEPVPAGTSTLIEALAWHVRVNPDRVHLRLWNGSAPPEEITYRELWREAGSVAAGLLAHQLCPGDRAAIMLPTGRDYFTSFVGVLLAGAVPVPLYPPAQPSRLAEHLRRQVKILDNAQARLLVTEPEAALLGRLLRGHARSLREVLTPGEVAGRPEVPTVARTAGDTALLQYTSGSTGDPKGVVLTHGNLLANIRAMGQAAGVGAQDVFVSWLPLYHDMGLIGAWLSSLYFGMPLVVMSPLEFLTRPSQWLWAIHAHRGTLTAAPNFAYELCLRKIDPAELVGLDLGSLRMAFNGAEPVAATTLSRFGERFAGHGLRPGVLAPVYGLAETCVGLTFPPKGREPVVDRIVREEFLRTGRACPARPDDATAMRVVGCGRAIPGHQVRVVDAAGNVLGDRREGRIEFRGPSATSGYFGNPEATRRLLRHGWLDSGDLGYLEQGELFVTGRVKDLIIKAGRNLHPEDLERLIGELPGVRKGCVAAFGAASAAGGLERLVIVAETRETSAVVRAQMRDRIVAVTVDLIGTPPDEVLLGAPGVVLKTSSGKIRRSAVRERYERGELLDRSGLLSWRFAGFVARGALPWLRRVARAARTAAFAAWCWLVLVLVGVPVLLAVAVGRTTDGRRAAAARAARALATLTGTRISSDGAERLAGLPECVVVANHASYLDGIAMTAALPGSYTFVAGEVFATKPLIGFLLRRIGTRFVERTDAEQSVRDLERLVEAARAGEWLVVFPEGGLSPVRGLRPFRLGALLIAARAGIPVVPVAISGTREMMWPDHAPLISPGAIHLTVGAPIRPTGADWHAAVTLEKLARAEIAKHCGEPDLGE